MNDLRNTWWQNALGVMGLGLIVWGVRPVSDQHSFLGVATRDVGQPAEGLSVRSTIVFDSDGGHRTARRPRRSAPSFLSHSGAA